MNILVVEDDASGRKLFEVMLRKDGHEVAVVADAAAALAKLSTETFDAILLDLNLPDGQGAELCGRIRGAARASQIVVASGDGTPETVKDVLAAGADDFLVKPVDHGALRIRLAVARNRALRSPAAGGGAAGGGAAPALAAHADDLNAVTDNLPDIVTRFDLELRHVFVSSRIEAITGKAPREFLGKSNRETGMPAPQVELWEGALKRVRDTGRAESIEFEFPSKTGMRRFESRISAEKGTDGKILTLLVVCRDVTELQREREELRAKTALLESILKSISDGVVVCDERGKFLVFNDAGKRIIGIGAVTTGQSKWTERYGLFKPDRVTPVPENELPLVMATRGRSCSNVEMFVRNADVPDGVMISVNAAPWLDAGGKVLGGVAVIRDATRQKEREEQLLQIQKLEAIGKLSGGVAHDFNNLLLVIRGYADLLQQQIPEDDAKRKSVTHILTAADRAAKLTQQLLAFGRQQILQGKVIDLGTVVTEAAAALRPVLGAAVEVKTLCAADLGSVRADPVQIQQAITNLALNARDAMPSGGTLTLETANVELDDVYAGAHPNVKPGPHVLLAISDTGTGISEETRRHLFEPFFTTKGKGKGTGLGLATVYGIVKQSGGHVWVYTEVGHGTTFKIYLPREDKPLSRETTRTARIKILPSSETVLIVDDDSGVRDLVRDILIAGGYEVLEAEDGPKAMELSASYRGEIHLLVTDVVMPGMNGRELADKLSPTRPKMKILFCSGYTDDAIVRDGVLKAGLNFLQKPYTPGVLAQKVRKILDQSA